MLRKFKESRLSLSSIYLVITILFIFSLFPLVSAEELNITKQQAEKAIEVAKLDIAEMIEAGFNVQRVNDTLKKAIQIFDAQVVIESKLEKKLKPDYGPVVYYTNEIKKIKELAFEAKDELFSLEKEYESFKIKIEKFHINISEIENMMKLVRQEMRDERYEKVLEVLPEARKKMIEAEAQATTLNLVYEVTTRTLKDFFKENYIYIILIILLLIIFYIIFRKRIIVFILRKKIKSLETEKSVLKSLIKETQNDYFQKGKISERVYNIRTKKFAELIRDIERKIPLLQEQLAKYIKINESKIGKKIKKKKR